MKKALVDYLGYVKEIVEPGQDYEIYSGDDCTMQWVDAPDDIIVFWTLEYSPSAGKMIWVERDIPYQDPILRRQIGYGDVGKQLGMIYDDLIAGNFENGSWVDHIKKVKETIGKPPASAYETTPQEFDVEREPSVTTPIIFSSLDLPAWVRYEGWKGPNTIV